LTYISATVIITISVAVITAKRIKSKEELQMPTESIVLTEAVYYILLSLFSPLHGYGIMQKVDQLSSGRVKLAAGTLYGAINTMLEKGWIRALPGERNSRRKEYEITELGKGIIANELFRLRELLTNGELIAEIERERE